MNQLEQTIVSHARRELEILKSYVGRALTVEDREDAIRAHHELSALVQLSLVADSGMSEEAAQALRDIEAAGTKAVSALGDASSACPA